MKTNVRDSSLEAYYGELVVSGLAAQQATVLVAMVELGGWVSRKQIARHTGLETGTVAGRVNALIAAGLVEEEPDGMPCPISGRCVHMVRKAEEGAGI